ncbi:hypothetical protein GPEL0_01r5283 [Geoanaerobacter pelophilus]|uniref:Uncharacterized protein n=1 Tax=Geoanaerobacter pelophilus TaxID=60036 RepID=A0ABQ0MP85_9BACT|nr:hypothetical protein GPEL0_01r5283 [Geoanaerobacter pelophilus]
MSNLYHSHRTYYGADHGYCDKSHQQFRPDTQVLEHHFLHRFCKRYLDGRRRLHRSCYEDQYGPVCFHQRYR